MSRKRDRDLYYPAPLDLTEEERREWWLRQRSKFVWEEGDVKIIKRGDGKEPEDDDRSKDRGQ